MAPKGRPPAPVCDPGQRLPNPLPYCTADWAGGRHKGVPTDGQRGRGSPSAGPCDNIPRWSVQVSQQVLIPSVLPPKTPRETTPILSTEAHQLYFCRARLIPKCHCRREVIQRRPEEFKIQCLMNIQKLFAPKPFYAGFGNKGTDAVSYRAVDVPDSRILIINPQVRNASTKSGACK